MKLEEFREWLPSWSPVRVVVMVVVVLILLKTGVSLFHTPSHEILYTHDCIVIPPGKDGNTLVNHKIELGNTGGNEQDNVKIRLLREAVGHSVMPILVRNFGVSERPYDRSLDGDTAVVLAIGGLEPEKRVTITITLMYKKDDVVHKPDQVLLGIEPTCGKVKKGNPGMTLVGRAWFGLYDLFR